MMTKINRIHVFGCSFTAGAELMDHIIFSSLGNMEEIDHIKFNCRGKFETNYKSYILPEFRNSSGHLDFRKVESEQKKFVWPAKLEKITGIPIFNHGIPGTSNDLMFSHLDRFISDGNILSNDLVIIGLTSPNRVSYFNPYNDHRAETYHPLADGQNRFSIKFKQEYVEKILTRKYMLWKFHEAKLRCKLYNYLIDNRVVFLESIHKSEHYYQVYCDGTEDVEFVNHLRWFETKYNNRLNSSFNQYIEDYREADGSPKYEFVHGNFHPKEALHEKIAHDIYIELKNRYQIGES